MVMILVHDKTNECNLQRDQKTYGHWSEVTQDYFSNSHTLRKLYTIFMRSKPSLTHHIDIIELGSAEGILGEYFARNLSRKRTVGLTLVDRISEHLTQNKNQNTRKVCDDLLTFVEPESFDLCLMRSVLQYFKKESQRIVLKNAWISTKPGGHLLLQAFVPYQESIDLFITLNEYIGKQLVTMTSDEIKNMCTEVDFEVNSLGTAPIWKCSSQSLRMRYDLTDSHIAEMISIIRKSPTKKRKGFKTNKEDFTIPIPYEVYLLKKSD